jgi:hypothetical protein
LNVPNIILLGETKELADLGGALGAEALGLDDIGEAGDIWLSLLDDGEGKNSEILSSDATTDGLALALTSAARSVAGVAFGEEELDTGREHLWLQVSANLLALSKRGSTYDTLLHGKALLVVATGDANDLCASVWSSLRLLASSYIAFPLIT